MSSAWDKGERRRFKRIEKNFIISYFDRIDPKEVHSISQVKNISIGGMCFITSQEYPMSAKLVVQLKTPYLAEMLTIEGTVLESHAKVPKMIYETRLVFDSLSAESESALNRIVETFLKLKQEHDHG
jgi:hypothetical protein